MTATVTDQTSKDMLSKAEMPVAPTLERTDEIDAYLEAFVDVKHFSGTVLIALGDADIENGGKAIARRYGLANQEHQVANAAFTKFRIGSVTKQFTAAAVLQLQEKGALDLQAAISTYLPDYPEGDRITIHHLLTHTSGIPEYLSPETFPDLLEWMRQTSTVEQTVDRFKTLPLEFAPGEKFRYSNSGYILLTQIIETVSEQPYADYLKTNIFDPLDLNDTGYEVPQLVVPNLAQGYLFVGDDTYLHSTPFDMSLPQGAGGLYSTAADLAAWTQWLHDEQKGLTVLSADLKKAMMQPIVKMEPEDGPDTFYGYGLVSDALFGRQRVHHNGGISGFSSALAYYPEDALTVVVLSNSETTAPYEMAGGLAAIAFQAPYEIPKESETVDLDPSLYEKYIGTYQLMPEMQILVRVTEGELTAQATGQGAFVLYPSSETEFFAKVAEITVTFSLAEDKTAEGLTLFQMGQELFAPKVDE